MPRPDVLLRHIGYAEEWLRRARRDWRRGDGAAAVRRLLLAEAEIRHARETAAVQPVRAGARADAARRLVAGLAAVIVLAAGMGYALTRAGAPRSHAVTVRAAEGRADHGVERTIVQLDSGRILMAGPGEDSTEPPAGPGVAVRDAPADRTHRDRAPRFAVPVDLRTSSPTF
jgi:hypothetical protein